MGLLKQIFGRKRIKEPKPINLTTAKYFIQGHIREFAKNFNMVDEHILEQASWREEQVKIHNPKCFELGKCEYCECGLQESLLSDPACKHGCFPEMMTKEQWQNYKNEDTSNN